MHLRRVEISNFRSITDFKVLLADDVNLIIGPNAVGKTTVLEAIRLAKAVLCPRTQQESRQVLVSLGATSNQLPQTFNYSAIAGDVREPIRVVCEFLLSESELLALPQTTGRLITDMVASNNGISLMQEGQLALVQFLSTPIGQQAMHEASATVQTQLATLQSSRSITLSLTIEASGRFSGGDGFQQSVFSQMENRLSPSKSLFSYFPADRAMPPGEAVIQLGSADAQQQLESHNSQAALKYQRLKSTIFSSFVESNERRNEQETIFNSIFLQLLKEKTLEGISINEYGQATILIRDTLSGKTFDIDSLSSGEKGLILTFLLIWKSMEAGGVVLIDEPELHLNSAVCKDLLAFMADTLLKPRKIQVVICTHSPEIIATAMRREDSTVFHLKKNSAVATIRKQDQPELVHALRLLGTSEIEELLYEGIIFVEGEDDVELLELAFPETRSRLKMRYLQGRGEVEKLIRELQKFERTSGRESISYFVFDRDGKPTSLESTQKVILRQWDRYCLENYLLDQDVLFDVVKREFKTATFPDHLGEALALFQRVALKQLSAAVIEEVYRGYQYRNAEIRQQDKHVDTFEASADALFKRLQSFREQVKDLDEGTWKAEFCEKCTEILKQRCAEWAGTWQSKCNGKQFLVDLRQECDLRVSLSSLKRRLLLENKAYQESGSESWKLLKATFQSLIA